MVNPFRQLKYNAIGNLICLGTYSFILCLKSWAIINNLEFSLREVNLQELGGWVDTQHFKKMCTKANISKYSDIRDDCEILTNYEMGGILLILFAVFGMGIQAYNILSSFASGYRLNIEVIETEFPHLIAPIAFTVALLLYLISIIFHNFEPQFAFYLYLINLVFSYSLAIHYKIFKSNIEGKNPNLNFIL